ncbi:hypothetical protein [Erwinia sp.]|uniref:hypothetical protein n=1 Tax=Erwinia citreus TaxID=558 RepID=UPI003C70F8B0
MRTLLAILLTVISTSTLSQSSNTEENPVTANDIALEPDDIMLTHAKEANTLLLGDIPKGFALDETHTPHITLLQQFVLTKDFDQVYAAIDHVIKGENSTIWKLEEIKY